MRNEQNWQKLCDNFVESPKSEKIKFLSLLLWATTMAARLTYEPGTEGVLHPKPLRRLTELAHRIAQFQRDILYERDHPSDKDFFDYVSVELVEIGCSDAVYDSIKPNLW
jgi:hypothetical protein